MRLQQYSLVSLVSIFVLTLTGRASFGFTLVPPQPGASEYYRKESDYTVDNIFGTTELDTRLWWDSNTWNDTVGGVTEIKRGGTGEFLRRLTYWSILESSSEYSWSFLPAEEDLEGSFEIVTNQACGLRDHCGGASTPISSVKPHLRGVGSLFHVKYHPGLNDPKPGENQLHWIQMVQANYSGKFPGLPVVRIDTPARSNPTETPYYDFPDYRFAGEDFLMDQPYIGGQQNARSKRYFNAQLYLVEEITPPGSKKREVKIYNGIRWGWKNKLKSGTCDVGYSQNGDGECVLSKKFSESLSRGTEEDNFYLDGLTPGATFYAWINNDLASNQCNPNTYLSGYNDDGYFLGGDDNSSHLGDGFGSAVWGTVSNNGKINLSVKAAHGGARGEDEGNYDLYVNIYDSEDFPLDTDSGTSGSNRIVVGNSGSSGGGGIVMGVPDDGSIIVSGSGGGGIDISTPGRSQQNPIFPDSIDNGGWQTFNNVPGCRWYDPPIANTFEFVATDNTLFTEILDFPTGEDNLFTVVVDDMVLGEYSPGDRVDFVSLLGRGISNFKITDIDYLVGSTEETYFPIQLAFDKNVGSFKMRMVEEEEPPKKKVPESNSIWGLIALGAFGLWKIRGFKNRK